MGHVTEKNNFVYLAISLVLLLLIGALVDQFPSELGKHLVQVFTVITLLVGVFGIKSSRLMFRTGIGFVITVALLVVLSVFLERAELYYMHLFALIVYYSLATWMAARQVLFTGPIDSNKIVGAICIYLLMGLIWTLLYLMITQAIPEAFIGLKQAPWLENFANAAYYSFVTLTTLGYGDISPVAPLARFLVYMEAITGAFYMAILVASLIGIRTSTIQSRNK